MSKSICLVGKGPSISKVDWNELPSLRLAINHAAIFVPNVTAVIALDQYILDWYEILINEGTLPYNTCVFLRDIDMCDVPNRFIWKYGIDVKVLGNTPVAALQLLKKLDFDTIHMVGFDAIDQDYSRDVTIQTYMDNIGHVAQNERLDRIYKRNIDLILQVINDFNINVEWSHRSINNLVMV